MAYRKFTKYTISPVLHIARGIFTLSVSKTTCSLPHCLRVLASLRLAEEVLSLSGVYQGLAYPFSMRHVLPIRGIIFYF